MLRIKTIFNDSTRYVNDTALAMSIKGLVGMRFLWCWRAFAHEYFPFKLGMKIRKKFGIFITDYNQTN